MLYFLGGFRMYNNCCYNQNMQMNNCCQKSQCGCSKCCCKEQIECQCCCCPTNTSTSGCQGNNSTGCCSYCLNNW